MPAECLSSWADVSETSVASWAGVLLEVVPLNPYQPLIQEKPANLAF